MVEAIPTYSQNEKNNEEHFSLRCNFFTINRTVTIHFTIINYLQSLSVLSKYYSKTKDYRD